MKYRTSLEQGRTVRFELLQSLQQPSCDSYASRGKSISGKGDWLLKNARLLARCLRCCHASRTSNDSLGQSSGEANHIGGMQPTWTDVASHMCAAIGRPAEPTCAKSCPILHAWSSRKRHCCVRALHLSSFDRGQPGLGRREPALLYNVPRLADLRTENGHLTSPQALPGLATAWGDGRSSCSSGGHDPSLWQSLLPSSARAIVAPVLRSLGHIWVGPRTFLKVSTAFSSYVGADASSKASARH